MTKPVEHEGLPVPGYRPQSEANLALVRANKEDEETILRQMDRLQLLPDTDKRWLAVSRLHIEQGYMALNRAIMRPERITLPDDEA